MSGKPIEMAGLKFGSFTIIGKVQPSDEFQSARGTYWQVECNCGTSRIVLGGNLRSGKYSSCGCQRKGGGWIDITGKRFDRLVVLRQKIIGSTNKNSKWIVACDCGTEKAVDGASLRAGRIKSCGCARKGSNSINLIGKRFGKIVISCAAVQKGKSRASRWVGICDCGTQKEFAGQSLRAGITKDCGCERKLKNSNKKTPKAHPNMIGKRFGLLTVISQAPTAKRQRRWTCACDCGGEKIASTAALNYGSIGSCGCARHTGSVVRPEFARKKQTEHAIFRRKNDIRFALNKRMRDLMRKSIKTRGGVKSNKWELLAGYSVELLKEHLESTLPEGSTWSDFLSGHLHIDHIIPLVAFNFSKDSDIDFKRAWSITNLRLLPAAENCIKNGTLEHPFQPSLAM